MSLSRSVFGFLLFAAIAAVLVGCGSSTGTNFQRYDGRRTLPTSRTIPHPDSLRSVAVTTRPDSVDIALSQSYAALTRRWSVQLQSGARAALFRPYDFNTYATLMNRELTLATLKRDERISSLSPEAARKRLRETQNTYESRISFRVHLYLNASLLSSPLSTVRNSVTATLRIDGDKTYDPVHTETLGVEFVNRAGSEVYHYPIVLQFPRRKNGRDVLAEADRLILSVRPFPSITELVFEWERKSPPS